jgi:ubiquinone/menaquinone biosynthesis C-methylase UbiE
LALSSKGSCQVVGMDIQPLFYFARQERKERGYNNLVFIHGTTESLANDSFDIVISHDSFEHFEEPEKMLGEMSRITKKGGYILIKFGPTWRGPYGRHMSGTIRRDRPWVHLIVPERVIMHCHSVYHDYPKLRNNYSQLQGGLNKMTVKRFKKMLKMREDLKVTDFEILTISKLKIFTYLRIINEFIASGVRAFARKK